MGRNRTRRQTSPEIDLDIAVEPIEGEIHTIPIVLGDIVEVHEVTPSPTPLDQVSDSPSIPSINWTEAIPANVWKELGRWQFRWKKS